MDAFTKTRILDLIEFPWEEVAFSRYLLENPTKCKHILVPAFTQDQPFTDAELAQESWLPTKNSGDYILRLVESLYSVTEDEAAARYVSENWDAHFSKRGLITKRKHFEKFFTQMPNHESSPTLSVLKALSKDCANIATHFMDDRLGSVASLKHSSKPLMIIKTVREVQKRLQVAHCFESVCKTFTMRWQLVLDFQWLAGRCQTDLAIYISYFQFKRSLTGSELEEAITTCLEPFVTAITQGDHLRAPSTRTPSIGPVADQEESTDTAGDDDLDGTPSLVAEEEEDSFPATDSHSLVAHSWSRFFTYTVTSGSGERARHIQSSNPSLLVGSTFRTVGSFGSLSMDEALSEQPVDQMYSAPFLLPGEVIQAMMGNVKHRYDVPPSAAQAPAGTKNRSGWFTRRSTSKPAKLQVVHGCLLLTTFQVIFVPASSSPAVARSPATTEFLMPSQLPSVEQSLTHSRGGLRKSCESNVMDRLLKKHRRADSDGQFQAQRWDDYLDEEPATTPSPSRLSKQQPETPASPLSPARETATISNPDEHLYVPYQMIYKAERVGKNRVSLHCKDFRSIHLAFHESEKSIDSLMQAIAIYTPACPAHAFAPRFAAMYKSLSPSTHDGWQLYHPETELRRILREDPAWRITHLNQHYDVCDTYPRVLAFPSAISDEELLMVKNFRSRGRLPALSWRHPGTGASLTRCSQPRVGLSRSRCKEDEKLIQVIRHCNQPQEGRGDGRELYLLDARPRANAMANQAVGAGYENETHYKNTKLKFLQIPNIHVMRESVRKLHELVQPDNDTSTFYTQLDACHWLEYVQLIMRSALRIAKLLNSGTNVLIHCSDGWDRTSQLSSVAMILLDPYYRSLKGFICLLEKEWLGYGHKFADRCGHNAQATGESETSPVFLQFVDCVWQIMQQFPSEFEFTPQLLITILDHCNISQFGTFLCNSVREREEAELPSTTISLWSFVYDNKSLFCSPYYVGYQDAAFRTAIGEDCHVCFIKPNTSFKALRVWTDYYLRYDRTYPKSSLLGELHTCAWNLARFVDPNLVPKGPNASSPRPAAPESESSHPFASSNDDEDERVSQLEKTLEEERQKTARLEKQLEQMKNSQTTVLFS